jgi:hypothetical protein
VSEPAGLVVGHGCGVQVPVDAAHAYHRVLLLDGAGWRKLCGACCAHGTSSGYLLACATTVMDRVMHACYACWCWLLQCGTQAGGVLGCAMRFAVPSTYG